MDMYVAGRWRPANAAGLAASSQYQRLAGGKVLPPRAAVAEALPVKPQYAPPSRSYGCSYNSISRCGR